MRQLLKLHPTSRCDAVREVAVEAVRLDRSTLRLRYSALGAMTDLLIPPPATPARTDALWQHTCFEAFLRPRADESYLEFNLAPSTEWAAYAFSGYRSAMEIVADASVSIDVEVTDDTLTLVALLEGLPDDAGWRIGLSAVMEEKSGRKSYWALAHPPGKPDFHHSDCFALELP